MNIIKYIISKKEIEEELENLDRDLYLEKCKNSKLKNEIKKLEKIEETNYNLMKEKEELKKEIRRLKREIKKNKVEI